MPYVDWTARDNIDAGETPFDVGSLTYKLTKDCLDYLLDVDDYVPRFSDYAEVLGALEATKLEMYRRAVAPYENGKVAENGDLDGFVRLADA